MDLQPMTTSYCRHSPSLSREVNVLQSFLWYSFYLLTIRRGIAENSRYTFFDEDISIEEKINNAISQNEFEWIGAGARRFPVLERKGGPPAFGWWGKVDSCMLEQRGLLLKLWVIICLCIEGTYREKGIYLSKYIYGKIWNSSLTVYE